MTSPYKLLAFSVAAASLTFLAPRVAHAGFESCGHINVSVDAKCQVETSGGCTASCTPISFEAACAGKLKVSCDGSCNASASVDCTGSCTGSCQASCATNPGTFDCSASCKGTCEADCSGKCSSSGNQSECEASCKASCGGSCDAKCTGTPPSATCEAKCSASCSGSCTAKANVDCQVDCQAKGYVSCKADFEGGCKAKCTTPSGALFCDGQFVDTGDNLQNCVDALDAYLKEHVKASASAECSGNECSAEAKASATCASVPGDPGRSSGLWLLGVVGAVVAAGVRRRPVRR